MASVNKVILLGTLGRDPEVRFSANQLPIASLSLATSSFRRSAESQDRIEETEWHRVTLFGRQAEIAQQYLRKGSRAYIEGRLRTRKYEKDGQTHYVTEIVAEQLQLIDRRQDSPAARILPPTETSLTEIPVTLRAEALHAAADIPPETSMLLSLKLRTRSTTKNLRSNLDFKPLFCGFFTVLCFYFRRLSLE